MEELFEYFKSFFNNNLDNPTNNMTRPIMHQTLIPFKLTYIIGDNPLMHKILLNIIKLIILHLFKEPRSIIGLKRVHIIIFKFFLRSIVSGLDLFLRFLHHRLRSFVLEEVSSLSAIFRLLLLLAFGFLFAGGSGFGLAFFVLDLE